MRGGYGNVCRKGTYLVLLRWILVVNLQTLGPMWPLLSDQHKVPESPLKYRCLKISNLSSPSLLIGRLINSV